MEKSRKRITHIRNSAGMEFESESSDVLGYDAVDSIIKDSMANRQTICLNDLPKKSHGPSEENYQALRRAEEKFKKLSRSQKFPLMEKTQKDLKQIKHNRKMPKPRAHCQSTLDSDPEEERPPPPVSKCKKSVKNVECGSSAGSKVKCKKTLASEKNSRKLVENKSRKIVEKESKKLPEKESKTIVPKRKNEDIRTRSVSEDSSSSDDDEFEKFVQKEKRALKKFTSKKESKRGQSSSKDAKCKPSKAQNNNSLSKMEGKDSLFKKKSGDRVVAKKDAARGAKMSKWKALLASDSDQDSEKALPGCVENSAAVEQPVINNDNSYSNIDSDCYGEASEADNISGTDLSARPAVALAEPKEASRLRASFDAPEVDLPTVNYSMAADAISVKTSLDKSVSETNKTNATCLSTELTNKNQSIESDDDSDIEILAVFNKGETPLLDRNGPEIAKRKNILPPEEMHSSVALDSIPEASVKLEPSSELECSSVVKKEVPEDHNPVYMTNMCADFTQLSSGEEPLPGRSADDQSKSVLKSEENDVTFIDRSNIKHESDEDIIIEFEGKVPKEDIAQSCLKRCNPGLEDVGPCIKVPKLEAGVDFPSNVVQGDIPELLQIYKKETQLYEHILETERTFEANLKKLERNQADKLKMISSLILERVAKDQISDKELKIFNSAPSSTQMKFELPTSPPAIKTEADDLNSGRTESSLPYQKCASCGERAVSACKKCAKVFFCSDTCGLRVWNERHKEECGK